MPPLPSLTLYCTLAPLLSIPSCAIPGALELELDRIVAAGCYIGVEAQVSQILACGIPRFASALRARSLRLLGKIYSSGGAAASPYAAGLPPSASGILHPPPGESVEAHLAVWRAQLHELTRSAELRPLLAGVNSQAGHDSWHIVEGGARARAWLSAALAEGAAEGVPVFHETHRGRLLSTPWAAVEAVRSFPTLQLLADLSHYPAACEAAPGEALLERALAELTPACHHVHARVGHAEGPQVADPRLAAHEADVAGHLRWWLAIGSAAAAAGRTELSMCPEFLPPPYCPRDARGEAVADFQEVNEYMAGWLQREWVAAGGALTRRG